MGRGSCGVTALDSPAGGGLSAARAPRAGSVEDGPTGRP